MTEVSSHSSRACRRKIAVRGGPAGRRQVEVAALGVGDEAVRDEPAEHLAGGLGGDAEVAGDLGGRDAAGIVGAGEHAQGEEVFLGGGRQVALVVASRHRRQDTGLVRDRERADPADDRDGQTGQPREEQDGPRAARRESPSAAPPVADRMSDGDDRGGEQASGPPSSAIDAAAGTRAAGPRGRATWRTKQRTGRPTVVAGRGEPAAAGHLADEPAEPERDREPADERPRDAAARCHRSARRSGRGAMSAAARPRSGGGGRRSVARRRRPRCVRASRRVACAAGSGRSRPPRRSGRRRRRSSPTRSRRVGRVGRTAGRRRRRLAGSAGGRPRTPRRPGSAPRPGPRPRARAARRARAWYSGPCLRGSAYSFGLSVQYVPLVVPYQLAPPQSGSNGPVRPVVGRRPERGLVRLRAASPPGGGGRRASPGRGAARRCAGVAGPARRRRTGRPPCRPIRPGVATRPAVALPRAGPRLRRSRLPPRPCRSRPRRRPAAARRPAARSASPTPVRPARRIARPGPHPTAAAARGGRSRRRRACPVPASCS